MDVEDLCGQNTFGIMTSLSKFILADVRRMIDKIKIDTING